jgi:hypothetical protein
VVLFALLSLNPDLPIEAVIEFLSTPDMVVAVHYSAALDMLQAYVASVSKVCCKCFMWMLQK